MVSMQSNVLLCLATGFLSFLPGGERLFPPSRSPLAHARPCAPAMNQYGRWEIVQSNDPLVQGLPPPRIVDIAPGRFSIPNKVFGGFRFEPSPSPEDNRVYVSMTMFNMRIFKKTYLLVPMDPDRMALFGTGSAKDIYYILERFRKG